MAFTLPQQMVRTVGVFQGLLALPILLFTAVLALEILAYSSTNFVYEFWSVFLSILASYMSRNLLFTSSDYFHSASMFISLFAAGIIFAVWIQRTVQTSRKVTLYFEGAKSAFATAIWLWLILDAAFGPGINRYRGQRPRKPMVLRAAISVIVLLLVLPS